MSFDAGSIVGGIAFDTSEYVQGMLQAQSIAQLFPSVVTNFLANPLLGLVGIAKQAAGAISSAFTEIGGAADDAGEAAQKVGVSVGFLTTVGAAAADAGSSVEGFADSLKFLNKNASDAGQGEKTASDAFARIGVSVTDAGGNLKSTEALFYETVDAINAMANPADRTAAAMDLLGRGGSDMLAFIGQGSGQIKQMAGLIGELGGGIDDNLAGAGDKFGTLTTLFDAALNGIKKAVAQPLLEGLADHFDQVVSAMRVGSTVIRSTVSGAFSVVAAAVGAVRDVLPGLGGALGGVQPLFDAWLTQVKAAGGLLLSLGGLVGDVLVGAFNTLQPAIVAMTPLFETVYAVTTDLYRFLAADLVPVVGSALTAAFAFLQPVLAATGGLLAALAPWFEVLWGIVRGLAIVITDGLTVSLNALAPVLRVIGDVLGWVIGLLADFVKWIGETISKVTDFLGLTDRAARATREVTSAASGASSSGSTSAAAGSAAAGAGGGVVVNQTNQITIDAAQAGRTIGDATQRAVNKAKGEIEQSMQLEANRALVKAGVT